MLLLKIIIIYFLEHDAHNEIITVEKTEKGVRLKDVFKSEF
jgi:predicted RNA-binding protein